jgi:hypothetical protein
MLIIQWNQWYRDVCAATLKHIHSESGIVVEIDETYVSKYRVGPRQDQWMFGGMERGSVHAFLRLVDRRNADTLLPIIQEYVLPGTTIMSDLWGSL